MKCERGEKSCYTAIPYRKLKKSSLNTQKCLNSVLLSECNGVDEDTGLNKN